MGVAFFKWRANSREAHARCAATSSLAGVRLARKCARRRESCVNRTRTSTQQEPHLSRDRGRRRRARRERACKVRALQRENRARSESSRVRRVWIARLARLARSSASRSFVRVSLVRPRLARSSASRAFAVVARSTSRDRASRLAAHVANTRRERVGDVRRAARRQFEDSKIERVRASNTEHGA